MLSSKTLGDVQRSPVAVQLRLSVRTTHVRDASVSSGVDRLPGGMLLATGDNCTPCKTLPAKRPPFGFTSRCCAMPRATSGLWASQRYGPSDTARAARNKVRVVSSQRPQSASASSSLARRSGSPRSMAPRQPQIEGRYFTRYLSPSLPTVLSPRSPSRRISERPRRCKRDTRPIPRTVGPNKNTCSVEVSPHALFAQRA